MSIKSLTFDCKGVEKDETNTRRRESSQAFQKLMAELDQKEIQPLKISWVEGAVILKRGGEEINRIEKFVPVNIKKRFKDRGNHVGYYPWEQYIDKYFDVKDSWKIHFQKDRLAYYKKALGGNPKTYVREFQACMFKAFIPEDLRHIVHNFCRTGKKRLWLPKQVTTVPEKAETLRQMIKDGQTNITPFLLASDECFDVSDFRKHLGKGAWKKLLKNSPTRNHLICEAMRKGFVKGGVFEAMNYPSTILKNPENRLGVYPLEAVELMKKDKVLTKVDIHHKYVQVIKDTKNMYRQLGRELPKQAAKWDLNKWEEKHEWCIEQINLKKYSKDAFQWMNGLHKTFTADNGFTAEILDNAFAIRTEGDRMKHCVGSYSERVQDQKYLVVSIKDSDGKNYSTLGCYLRIDEDGYVEASFNQHYRHCNKRVEDVQVKDFADWIIVQINKQFKEKDYETVYEQSENSLEPSTNLG